MKVPITPEERCLFENNATQEELLADELIQTFEENLNSMHLGDIRFVSSGYIPTSALAIPDLPYGVKKLDVLKRLVERGILSSYDTQRKKIGVDRSMVYEVTDEYKHSILKKLEKDKPVPAVPGLCQENLDFTGTVTPSAA